jgi:hypothetical protein
MAAFDELLAMLRSIRVCKRWPLFRIMLHVSRPVWVEW